jgi:hypothetical protein
MPLTTDSIANFRVQKTFVYSVFESSLQPTKLRHVVQTPEKTANAQAVCTGLLAVYEEYLTRSPAATDLTPLHFDVSWNKGSEALVLHWKCKILELEQLVDKQIDDATEFLWLPATMSTKSYMHPATEMTLLSMGNSNSAKMPWENFDNLVLSYAKLHNHTTPNKPRREAHLNKHGHGRGDVRRQGDRGRGRSYSLHRIGVPQDPFRAEELIASAKGMTPYTGSYIQRAVNVTDVTHIVPFVPYTTTNATEAADSHLRQLPFN